MPKTANLDAEVRAEARARAMAMARAFGFHGYIPSEETLAAFPAGPAPSSLANSTGGQDQASQLRSSPRSGHCAANTDRTPSAPAV